MWKMQGVYTLLSARFFGLATDKYGVTKAGGCKNMKKYNSEKLKRAESLAKLYHSDATNKI